MGYDACFANGVPAWQAAILAATQRPITLSAGATPPGPSWAIAGTQDHVIPLAEQLFMANQAHAHITEVDAGHLSLITDPAAVAKVIMQAAAAVG